LTGFQGFAKKGHVRNRRRAERLPHGEPVNLRSLTDQSVTAGEALDLSEGGCLVRLVTKLDHAPSLVVLDLTLDQQPTKLHAVVQRAAEVTGKSELGLRFVYLGDRERLALRAHLRATAVTG
jgi:c-di-GMP-binding flagellar brake protein YcgR